MALHPCRWWVMQAYASPHRRYKKWKDETPDHWISLRVWRLGQGVIILPKVCKIMASSYPLQLVSVPFCASSAMPEKSRNQQQPVAKRAVDVGHSLMCLINSYYIILSNRFKQNENWPAKVLEGAEEDHIAQDVKPSQAANRRLLEWAGCDYVVWSTTLCHTLPYQGLHRNPAATNFVLWSMAGVSLGGQRPCPMPLASVPRLELWQEQYLKLRFIVFRRCTVRQKIDPTWRSKRLEVCWHNNHTKRG